MKNVVDALRRATLLLLEDFLQRKWDKRESYIETAEAVIGDRAVSEEIQRQAEQLMLLIQDAESLKQQLTEQS